MVSLVPADSDEAINELADLANMIWNEYFPAIIGQAQVDYMVSKFQSAEAIRGQIGQGYDYYFLSEDDSRVGYCGIVPRPDKSAMQISKLYLLKDWRGKGLMRSVIDQIAELAIERGFNKLYLTVNKYNQIAIHAYQKIGFTKTAGLVMDIGNGFVMDDYEMQRRIP